MSRPEDLTVYQATNPASPAVHGHAGHSPAGNPPPPSGPPVTGPPAPYGGAPYGAPGPWEATPSRRRPWIIVAAVVGGLVTLLVVGAVVVLALISAGPQAYGDDPELDRLWDACAQRDGVACDEPYRQSPFGSDYEEFGDTCGGRHDAGAVWCQEVL